MVAKSKQMPTHRIDSADAVSPPLPAPASKLNLAAVPAMAEPLLPVSAAPEPQTDPASKGASSAPNVGAAEGVAHEEESLLALSTDPGNAKLALPPGNKYGEFSVSPAGTHLGSPGGTVTVAIGGGSAGISAGGDGSTGVGPGTEGGGGFGRLAGDRSQRIGGSQRKLSYGDIPCISRRSRSEEHDDYLGGAGWRRRVGGFTKLCHAEESSRYFCRCPLQTGPWNTARPASPPHRSLATAPPSNWKTRSCRQLRCRRSTFAGYPFRSRMPPRTSS